MHADGAQASPKKNVDRCFALDSAAQCLICGAARTLECGGSTPPSFRLPPRPIGIPAIVLRGSIFFPAAAFLGRFSPVWLRKKWRASGRTSFPVPPAPWTAAARRRLRFAFLPGRLGYQPSSFEGCFFSRSSLSRRRRAAALQGAWHFRIDGQGGVARASEPGTPESCTGNQAVPPQRRDERGGLFSAALGRQANADSPTGSKL